MDSIWADTDNPVDQIEINDSRSRHSNLRRYRTIFNAASIAPVFNQSVPFRDDVLLYLRAEY